jgi:hypothetical protein
LKHECCVSKHDCRHYPSTNGVVHMAGSTLFYPFGGYRHY